MKYNSFEANGNYEGEGIEHKIKWNFDLAINSEQLPQINIFGTAIDERYKTDFALKGTFKFGKDTRLYTVRFVDHEKTINEIVLHKLKLIDKVNDIDGTYRGHIIMLNADEINNLDFSEKNLARTVKKEFENTTPSMGIYLTITQKHS